MRIERPNSCLVVFLIHCGLTTEISVNFRSAPGLARLQTQQGPLEDGDGTQEKSGIEQFLSERSDSCTSLLRADFSKLLSGPEGWLLGVPFLWYFLMGKQRKYIKYGWLHSYQTESVP